MERTNVGEERTDVAMERTNVGEERSDVAMERTNVGEERSDVAMERTNVGEERSDVAMERTNVGEEQTDVAMERTDAGEEHAGLHPRPIIPRTASTNCRPEPPAARFCGILTRPFGPVAARLPSCPLGITLGASMAPPSPAPPSPSPAPAAAAAPALPLSLPQPRPLGKTARRDLWWVTPLLVFLGLGAFVVYSTWAGLQGAHYYLHGDTLGYETYRNYLSPFYSPVLFDAPGAHSGHAWFGTWPAWLNWLPPLLMTPALLILWAPGGFRLTCYYYRGAYYKAFWADPLSCTVGEPKFRGEKYRGERKLPLILQNVHRYFLYLALLFLVFLSYDAVVSYIFTDPATGRRGFGIGVGSLILTLNPILLGGYTLGCHSLRHLIGGRKRAVGGGAPRKAYDCVSCLNRRHMTWAWFSLFWVGFCDVYIRLCSMGVIHDVRLI